METIIHFVRHAKTQNPDQLIKGRLKGFPLRVDGMLEAKKIGEYLVKNKIFLILHSPMQRTQQTAEIIAKEIDLSKIKSAEALNEWDFKVWEGQPFEEIKKTEYWDIYLNNILDLDNQPIGEKPKQVISRMKKQVNSILTTQKGKEVVCVSHADPIKFLRCELENKDINKNFHKVKCEQPSITTFIFGGKKLKQVKYKSFVKNQAEFLQ